MCIRRYFNQLHLKTKGKSYTRLQEMIKIRMEVIMIKYAQKFIITSIFISSLFMIFQVDSVEANVETLPSNNSSSVKTGYIFNENPGNESIQKDASLGELQEDKKISTIFPDTVVAQYIANSLNKKVDDEVTQNDLDKVHAFNIVGKNVKSIEGFQYLRYANDICLYNNKITDLSPLNDWYPKSYWDGGYNIFHIWISGNPITDLTPLANLLMRERLKIFSLVLHDIPIDNSQIPNLRRISNGHTYIPKHTFGYNHIDDFEKLKGTIFADLNPLSIDGPTAHGTLGNWGHTIDMGNFKVDHDGNITLPNKSTYFDGSKIPVTEISNGGKASSDNNFITWKGLDKSQPEKLTFTVSKEPAGLCGTSVTYTAHLQYKDVVVGKPVIVKYQDTKGKELHPDIKLNGNVGDKYETEEMSFNGYTFKEIKGKATGKYTEADQTVTYVYTKDAVPAKQGKVTAKYVDTDGKTIATDKVITGDIDTAYQTEKQDIDGYTFKEIKGKATGKYTEADQTVTYVYTKQDNSKPTPNEGGNKQNNADKPGQSNSQNPKGSNKQKQDSLGDKVQTGVKKLLPNTGAKQQVYLSVLGVVILGTLGYYVIKKRK